MKIRMIVFAVTLTTCGFSSNGQELTSKRESAFAQADADKTRRAAELDSDSEFQLFKKDAERQYFENLKKFESLKLKNKDKDKDKEEREQCSKKIADFEKRNTELKNRFANFKHTTTIQWISFKDDFIRDMDQLEDEIRSMR